MAWKQLSADYVSPVRVRALKKPAQDPDPGIGQGLVRATLNKHEKVRSAALVAIARYGDTSLACEILPHLADKKAAVRYASAAALLRLSALAHIDCPHSNPHEAAGP